MEKLKQTMRSSYMASLSEGKHAPFILIEVISTAQTYKTSWQLSRYNLYVPLPDTDSMLIANTYTGICASYTPAEMYLLSVLGDLDGGHPVLKLFAQRGVIVDFDEKAALEARARGSCAYPAGVYLSICPTLSCNFDCPYCFEQHRAGRMSEKVQRDVIALADRMLERSRSGLLSIYWFGGEPLLYPDIIASMSHQLMSTAEAHHAEYRAKIVTNGFFLTPKITKMLAGAKISSAQITLDGISASHDRTRHLRGGGPTFDRIVSNLRCPGIPFHIIIRQNVYSGNSGETEKLRALVQSLKEETGNSLSFRSEAVADSSAHRQREEHVRRLCGHELTQFGIEKESGGMKPARGLYCGAHTLWSVAVDETGSLYKCQKDLGNPAKSFGTAAQWDPADPLRTSFSPDELTSYLNTAGALTDPECASCVWLPGCSGGCPCDRLEGAKTCVPYRDSPEEYVLSLFLKAQNRKSGKENSVQE